MHSKHRYFARPLLEKGSHPTHVGLKDLVLPAAQADALLVHCQRSWQVPQKVERLRQVEHYARIVWFLVVLRCQKRQIQLRKRSNPLYMMREYILLNKFIHLANAQAPLALFYS